MTYETLTGEEIENLINKNIYPSTKEDLKEDMDRMITSLDNINKKIDDFLLSNQK